MGTPELTPRIYVACLASYNAGTLHGRWIDCDQGVEEIREEIKKMLAESREPFAEEWAIHDYEGFGNVNLSEHEDLEKIAELAELIEENRELIADLVGYYGGLEHLEEAKQSMNENYAGEWDSLAGWAEELLEGQLDNVPKKLRGYIDFERYGKDMELDGGVFTIRADSKLHIFWNH